MKKIRVFISCLIVLVSFTGFGCAQNNSLQKKYGQDSAYFMALLSLENGNERQAEHLLKQAEKKASPLIARRSMEKLSQFGNVQERINRSYSLYKKFPDEETKLAVAKEFFKNKEYARVIRLTEKIDLKSCLNETAYYRLSSMQKKNDSRFSKDFFEWCVSRTFSDLH